MSNKPITRKEMFMAKASGQNVNTPEPITREEKYLDKIAKNGGKATSWKDLGEKTVMGDTLTWDGNTEGKVVGMEYVNELGTTIKYVKVSDAIPKFTDITDGFSISWIDGESVDFSSDQAYHVDSLIVFEMGIRVALEDETNYEDDEGSLYFPEKGTYFYIEGIEDYHGRTTKLTINGYNGFPRTEITPLPNKYLDFIETVGTDTLTWDGDTEGLASSTDRIYYCVSEVVPTLEDLQNGGIIKRSDTVDPCVFGSEHIVMITDSVILVNYGISMFAVAKSDNALLGSVGFEKAGVYLRSNSIAYDEYLTINNYAGFPKEQVKEECLPSERLFIRQNSDDSWSADEKIFSLSTLEMLDVIVDDGSRYNKVVVVNYENENMYMIDTFNVSGLIIDKVNKTIMLD